MEKEVYRCVDLRAQFFYESRRAFRRAYSRFIRRRLDEEHPSEPSGDVLVFTSLLRAKVRDSDHAQVRRSASCSIDALHASLVRAALTSDSFLRTAEQLLPTVEDVLSLMAGAGKNATEALSMRLTLEIIAAGYKANGRSFEERYTRVVLPALVALYETMDPTTVDETNERLSAHIDRLRSSHRLNHAEDEEEVFTILHSKSRYLSSYSAKIADEVAWSENSGIAIV